MRNAKKIISLLLAVVIILTAVPSMSHTAKAADGGVQEKIDKIRAVYGTGTYFTSDGKPHYIYNTSICPDACRVCHISGIPARGGLPAGKVTGYDGWQCWAFASYVGYIVFGSHFYSWKQVSLSSAKVGDVVEFQFTNNKHYGIFLYADSSYVYVYDANSDCYCKVVYGSKYATSRITKIYHANNYDTVNATTSYSYDSVTAGRYYLKNKATGKYMNVSYGKDENKQNIDVYTFNEGSKAELFEVINAPDGYKLRPLCSSSRFVNAWGTSPYNGSNVNLYDNCSDSTQWWKFEKVSGGYIIHNAYTPSCVLDVDGSNVLIRTRTGSDSQIWILEPEKHTCNKGTYAYYWAEHPHYNCYKCSICGTIWADRSETNTLDNCKDCKSTSYVPGDFDGDGQVAINDAIRLLYHILLPGSFPLNQNGDINNDGKVTLNDAIYLLYHILLPGQYPIR